jgi:hypothetical protein
MRSVVLGRSTFCSVVGVQVEENFSSQHELGVSVLKIWHRVALEFAPFSLLVLQSFRSIFYKRSCLLADTLSLLSENVH